MPFYPQNPGTSIEQNGTIIPASTISFANGTISTSGSTINYTAPQLDFVYGTLSVEPVTLTIGSGLVLTSAQIAPAIVQSNSIAGYNTIALPSMPTPGNLLVYIGWTNDAYGTINGFTTLVNSADIILQTKVATPTDTNTFSIENIIDNGYIFEISNSNSIAYGVETVSVAGSGPYAYSFGTVATVFDSLTLALVAGRNNGPSNAWSAPLPSGSSILYEQEYGTCTSCIVKYLGTGINNVTFGATNSTNPSFGTGGLYITFSPNPNVTSATLAT